MNHETSYKKKRMHTPLHLWWARIARHWPLYVWVLAIAGSILFYSRTAQFGGIQGVIQTIEEPIAPLETSRLQLLYVRRGQHVKKGDILAQMDTSLLDAKIAVDSARILEAQGTMSRYQQDIMDIILQFNMAIRDAEAALEAENIDMLKTEAELETLNTELNRRKNLKRKQLLSEGDVTELYLPIASRNVALETHPKIIELHEKRLKEVTDQREQLFEWLNINDTGLISDAVQEEMRARSAMLNSSIERRNLQRELYTLRANSDGVVSRIFHDPGSVVQAGDPVMLIVSEKSEWVLGFLAEVHLGKLNAGQEVYVQRRNKKGVKVEATIDSISPEIRELPGRISPIRNQPLRGRRVMVKMKQNDAFIPGETVRILNPFHFGNSSIISDE